MTAEEFYDKHYEDANHFYTSFQGIAVVSPKKIQQAMEAYAKEKTEWRDKEIEMLESKLMGLREALRSMVEKFNKPDGGSIVKGEWRVLKQAKQALKKEKCIRCGENPPLNDSYMCRECFNKH